MGCKNCKVRHNCNYQYCDGIDICSKWEIDPKADKKIRLKQYINDFHLEYAKGELEWVKVQFTRIQTNLERIMTKNLNIYNTNVMNAMLLLFNGD